MAIKFEDKPASTPPARSGGPGRTGERPAPERSGVDEAAPLHPKPEPKPKRKGK